MSWPVVSAEQRIETFGYHNLEPEIMHAFLGIVLHVDIDH